LSYTIIIPIYNEETLIPQLLNELNIFSINNEIIIVNDGSTDKSQKLLSNCTFIKLIKLKKNQGKGLAIQNGLDNASNKKIIIFDGDLELNTNEISSLMILDKQKKIDYVLGSRYSKIKSFKSIWNFGNFLITTLFNFLHRTKIKDALCCAKSFYSKDIPSDTINSKSFDIDIELTSKLISQKELTLKDIHLTYNRRPSSNGKKLKLTHGWLIIKRLLKQFY
jgi:glycosyltransferase involved in cell wall biosynthesis